MSKVTLEIDFDELRINDLYALYGMLKGKDKTKVNKYSEGLFGLTSRIWGTLSDDQIEALASLIKLTKLANKFNQRDGWWLEDNCTLNHDRPPHNNIEKKIVVCKGEVKVVKEKDYLPNRRFFLEFVDNEKYKGNPEYFAKTYEEEILKAAIFLKARKK